MCRKLIFECCSEDQLKDNMLHDDYFNESNHYHVVLVEKDEALYDAVNPILVEFTTLKSPMVYMPLENSYLLVFRNKTFRQLEVILHDLTDRYQRLTDLPCFITVGSLVNAHMKLKKSFEDAKSLYERRFLFRNQWTVFFDAYFKEDNEDRTHIMDTEYLYGLIEIGNHKAMDVYFTRLEKGGFVASSLSVDKIKGICVNGFIGVKEKLILNYKESSDYIQSNRAIIDQIYEYKHLGDIISYMSRSFVKVSDNICSSSNENTMKRLLNYIHNNYDKNLRLEGLARLFNYNSSYLGKIFKEKVGLSFNKYLDKIRIEHAKELLESGELKIYEVAEKVGYKSVDYFFGKFKKQVEMSPKAYRNLNHRSESEGEEQ